MTAEPRSGDRSGNAQPGSGRPSLEEQVRVLQDQLTQAQRMTALGELASTTTHEFNNVLMTVINYAKIGLRHKDEPTRTKAFEKIFAAGQRASKITNTVLGLARNRSEGYQPTDLAKLVEDALVLLERELSKYRVAVDRDLADDVPPALADGNQIQQVLLNLLVNARQAMPGGGTLTIRLSHDQDEDTADLLVRDSGCGIPQEKLPRIFDRFYSTKSGPDETGRGGTGVGLAACREIIEAHRGKIRVQSAEGKGTAFTLKLPIARTRAAATAAVAKLGVPQAASKSA